MATVILAGCTRKGADAEVVTKPGKELQQKAFKPGEWNDYRVRAEGKHVQIWLNDVLMTDGSENTKGQYKRGVIALELSKGMKGLVRFRDVMLEELPDSPDAEEATGDTPASRVTATLKAAPKLDAYAGTFAIAPNETFVFVGPENMITEQHTGWLETALTVHALKENPRFRHMGWEGDTVYRQNRMQNHGTWKDNLDAVDATAVIAWFGQNEVFDATKTAAEFKTAYAALLDELVKRTPRIVVVAPPPFEKPGDARRLARQHAAQPARLAGNRRRRARTRPGTRASCTSICSRRCRSARRTRRNSRATVCTSRPRAAAQTSAALIYAQLKIAGPSGAFEELRAEIVEKNRIWFDTWRCRNWAFAYGDRTTQPFATAADKFPSFVDLISKNFRPWIANADARIKALVHGEQPPARPELEPDPHAPDAKSPAEEAQQLTLYPGFSIKLFADETQGVIKPIQMRWDERGRLWVLCVPSYPQLQPGKKANDYLLILEDTNGTGHRRQRSTRFVEGLAMPMGFEFGDGGVYICEESTRLIALTRQRRTERPGRGPARGAQRLRHRRHAPDDQLAALVSRRDAVVYAGLSHLVVHRNGARRLGTESRRAVALQSAHAEARRLFQRCDRRPQQLGRDLRRIRPGLSRRRREHGALFQHSRPHSDAPPAALPPGLLCLKRQEHGARVSLLEPPARRLAGRAAQEHVLHQRSQHVPNFRRRRGLQEPGAAGSRLEQKQ